MAGIYDAASASDPSLRKQLAPLGWHVPNDAEWSTMINFLDPMADGGNNPNTAGGMMKTTGTVEEGTGLWYAPNTGASNVSGFSGAPCGFRGSGGDFVWNGSSGLWWSSSESNATFAWRREMNYNNDRAVRAVLFKESGFSVRCLRD